MSWGPEVIWAILLKGSPCCGGPAPAPQRLVVPERQPPLKKRRGFLALNSALSFAGHLV